MAVNNYQNKTIYIFGGSSGIGLAAASQFAAKGAHVIIFARNRQRLEAAVETIKESRIQEDRLVASRVLDISRYEDVLEVLNQTVEEFGPPDVLLNCAGRAKPDYFENINPLQFDETMRINLYGPWNTVSVLAPYMKGRGGYIINVSSIAGFLGVFGYTDYSASKFAVIGFSEALRSELQRFGITVSVLCPPDTDTPGFEAENLTKPEETKAISGNVKLMSPEKVAFSLLKGMAKEQFLIIPGLDGRLTHLAKRFLPGVVDFFIRRSIKKVNRDERAG